MPLGNILATEFELLSRPISLSAYNTGIFVPSTDCDSMKNRLHVLFIFVTMELVQCLVHGRDPIKFCRIESEKDNMLVAQLICRIEYFFLLDTAEYKYICIKVCMYMHAA